MRIRIQLFISMRIPTRIRIQEAKSKRIQADPDPDQTFLSKSCIFTLKNILKEGKMSKNIPMKVKSLFERQKTSFVCKFRPISMLLVPDPHSPIRIQIQDSKNNAYPGGSGSGSTTLGVIS
jgi:hypothetical protein